MIKSEIMFLKNNGYTKNPKMVQLELTTKCPLNCPYCYKDNLYTETDMDFEFLKLRLKECDELGVKYLMLNGGEVMMYSKLKEFFEELSKDT